MLLTKTFVVVFQLLTLAAAQLLLTPQPVFAGNRGRFSAFPGIGRLQNLTSDARTCILTKFTVNSTIKYVTILLLEWLYALE